MILRAKSKDFSLTIFTLLFKTHSKLKIPVERPGRQHSKLLIACQCAPILNVTICHTVYKMFFIHIFIILTSNLLPFTSNFTLIWNHWTKSGKDGISGQTIEKQSNCTIKPIWH